MENQFNCLLVVPLDFKVCHMAVPLVRGNMYMAQKVLVLDRGKIGIGVQEVRGEGVTKLVAQHIKSALSPIVLHLFLYAQDRYRRAGERPLPDEKHSFCLR